MALTPKLEIKQSQSLLMTPQLRQAINLLQMSNLELNELVEQELSGNPLLEREEDRLSEHPNMEPAAIDTFNAEDNSLPAREEASPDVDYDNSFDDDSASDREGYDTPEDFSWEDYNRRKNNAADDDAYDYFEQKLAANKSLYQIVEEQILQKFSSDRERFIARLLAESLDAAGYFRGDTVALAARLNTTEKEIRNILNRMKTFEPSGLFSETLSECLKIQLQDIGRADPAICKLLDNLDLLAARNFKELKKICQSNDEDIATMIADIKSLNPKPGTLYNAAPPPYIIPDVFVTRKTNAVYHIELNSLSLPRVLINRRYYSEVMEHAKQDKQARRYLKDNLGRASFLIKAMHQRASSVLRVSEEIVRLQHDFFEHGIEYLKPMSLKDIAYNLEMHESTVSRITANKYMQTPRGLFELKFFFSQAAGSYSGSEDTSTLTIKHKIKQLINAEDPAHILSDDKISELLATEGLKVARRTVAKYREAQNIPSSAERKRLKRP